MLVTDGDALMQHGVSGGVRQTINYRQRDDQL